ncbi:MAG: head GIN domain-containing protein [Prolixibacteraceae bacterium]
MKKFTSIIFMVAALFATQSLMAYSWTKTVKGNGKVSKEVRKVASFDGVKASAGINVYLFQGDEEKVVVETDENLQECLIVEVEGTILKCYLDCNVRNSSKLNVYVNFKKLNKIKASSGSDIYGETMITTDHMDIDVSSAADVKVELNAKTVNCDASSGSDAVIKGKADYLDADASSGADIKAADLVVGSCKASASSGADIRVTVTDKIDADASSGGDVIYYGNPKVEHINESSGGDVRRR